jgi:hypothetical protein
VFRSDKYNTKHLVLEFLKSKCKKIKVGVAMNRKEYKVCRQVVSSFRNDLIL